jgi:hypothetical protein
LHSAGCAPFSTRHSNRRKGSLAACCLNQAGRPGRRRKRVDSAENPEG